MCLLHRFCPCLTCMYAHELLTQHDIVCSTGLLPWPTHVFSIILFKLAHLGWRSKPENTQPESTNTIAFLHFCWLYIVCVHSTCVPACLYGSNGCLFCSAAFVDKRVERLDMQTGVDPCSRASNLAVAQSQRPISWIPFWRHVCHLSFGTTGFLNPGFVSAFEGPRGP